jgi:hypothetical protein
MESRPTIRHLPVDAGAASEDEDARLLRRAERGDTLSFERIVWRYDEALLQFLLLLTSSERQAVELCRATLLAAYRGLRRRPDDSIYIWLFRLAAAEWQARCRQIGGRPALSPREHLVFTLKARLRFSLATVASILDIQEDDAAHAFCRAVEKLHSN